MKGSKGLNFGFQVTLQSILCQFHSHSHSSLNTIHSNIGTRHHCTLGGAGLHRQRMTNYCTSVHCSIWQNCPIIINNILINNVVFPRFYEPVSRQSNIDAAMAQSQPHFMATLPSLLRFKNIPKLTNLAIKKLYGLPLQAFCIHKI